MDGVLSLVRPTALLVTASAAGYGGRDAVELMLVGSLWIRVGVYCVFARTFACSKLKAKSVLMRGLLQRLLQLAAVHEPNTPSRSR